MLQKIILIVDKRKFFMKFIFNNFTENTEAIITSVNVINEDFGLYELKVLGLDNDIECGYTNNGTVTIYDDELKQLLESKNLYFPYGIIGQRVKIVSNEEIRKEKDKAELLNNLNQDCEEIDLS